MSNQERDPRPTGWAIAYHFSNPEIAGRVYEDVRDAVLVDENSDASVFRFMVADKNYVAIVAQEPPPTAHWRRAEALMTGRGTPIAIPADVLEHLLDRRRAFKSTGLDYLERRARN